MPLIAFVCVDCGRAFEDLLGFDAPSDGVRCPDCGGAAEKQLPKFAVRSGVRADPVPEPFCGRCGENRPPCSAD